VVNIFAFRAAVGAPLEVYGSGAQVRPFVHVADIARAIAFCMADDRTAEEVFNVVGENASINDLLDLLKPRFPRLRVVHTDKEILNQISYEVDGSKLRGLGFAPAFSLEQGIEEYARLYGSFTRQPRPELASLQRSAASA
jgi:nucleoside-diphosphate-sugar epimerase